MKKRLTVLLAATIALTLAGCSQVDNTQNAPRSTQRQSQKSSRSAQNSSQKNNNSNSSSHTAASSPAKGQRLSANKIDYQTTASAITVYAAQKYGDSWQIALDAAKNNNLGVAFRNKNIVGITAGSGYVYEVSGTGKSSNARYMLSGNDNANKQITIYIKTRKLGIITLNEIVTYLNNHDDVTLVQNLAKKTRLGVHLIGDSDTANGKKAIVASSSAKNGQNIIPASLQGTWYTADTGSGALDKLTVSGNSINDEAGLSLKVEKKNNNSSASHTGYLGQTSLNGLNFYSFTNMGQTAGPGSTYLASHTEKGQTVIVSANYKGHTNAVYWPSAALAKANANQQFADLQY